MSVDKITSRGRENIERRRDIIRDRFLARGRDKLKFMERIPTPEQKVSDQKVIDALASNGIEDPEASQLLQEWTKQGEREVAEANRPEAAIEFNMRRARLYIQAGYTQEGLDVFESARTQAWNEQRQELYNQIMAEMDKIEGKPDELG